MTQQLTGIDSIMYFGQTVLLEIGHGARKRPHARRDVAFRHGRGGRRSDVALEPMDKIDRRKTFIISFTLTTTFHCCRVSRR